MRFLIDADLPRSTAALLRRYNHEATDVCDIGLGGAKDREIAAYARCEGLCLLTGDFDFSNVRNYQPKQYSGIVVLRLPKISTASFILKLLETFLKQYQIVTQIIGKLVIIESGRIRIRR
jgi:predicted nuclease of predicted toxin-antitoxin system